MRAPQACAPCHGRFPRASQCICMRLSGNVTRKSDRGQRYTKGVKPTRKPISLDNYTDVLGFCIIIAKYLPLSRAIVALQASR